MSTSAENFGRKLAKVLGNGPGEASLRAQEARLVDTARRRSTRYSRRVRLGFACAFAVAAFVSAFWIISAHTRPPPPVAENGHQIAVGETVRAHRQARSLSFADGSVMELKQETVVRVERVSSSRTEIALQDGRLDLSVQKHVGAAWIIEAGQYRVRVVGTRLSVVFEPKRQRIRVRVTQGRVLVFGEGLPPGGRPVDAGGHFEHHARPRQGTKSLSSPALETAPAHSAATPAHTATASDSGPTASSSDPVESWQALAREGSYRRALASAEALGFDSLLDRCSASELLMLANSARFAGNRARAEQAFLRLRERFAGTPSAVLASFYLARISLDMKGDRVAAEHWLRTYLEESPRGTLAQGARAELMNILLRNGDTAGARRMAKEYLKYHPEGEHAGVARSLLSHARVPR